MLLSVLSVLAGLTVASPLNEYTTQQVCNGHACFCDKKYSNVSLIGTHNAPFYGAVGDLRVNQNETVTGQLDAGIRFLTGQTHRLVDTNTTLTDDLYMCHTNCAIYNGGSLEDYLRTVKTWVDAHPNDVVTLLLTNGDYVDVSLYEPAFEITGMQDIVFVPATSPEKLELEDWPTYAEIIDSGKRVIVFLDYKANQTEVPYIMDEFTYFFETPYSQTDPDFSQCNLDRPPNGTADGRMYIVNHILNKAITPDIIVPDSSEDFTVNAATGNQSIGAQASLCEAKWERPPNVVLVDRFNRGDVFTAQNNLNHG